MQMQMQNLEMELDKPLAQEESRNELCEGDPNCKVARPTCNFIRHTLTFFSRCRSFPRANAQKGEDSCKGKAANAELDFYRNKSIIFWPSVIHHLFRGK